MHPPRRLIRDNETLRKSYQQLEAGDRVVDRVRLAPGEEYLLLDLAARGVELFPSALSQAISRSKVMQAALLGPFMLPHTTAIHDLHGLHRAVSRYHAAGISRVVTKLDRANAGLGVLLWNSVEEVLNQTTLGSLAPPFVLQPFIAESRDLRVIMLGDYQEAYLRHNPVGFRHNLHCGGSAQPRPLSPEQEDFCRRVMTRGGFPYAHLDLMLLPDNRFCLGEINLRGGLRGAQISPPEYKTRLQALLAAAC
ncbi:RimK family alpha-L-glutamate ligase [Desulfurivibrio sp. D14AmB]|uniref:ATP-grasp domain-containing protein n=1 Tax=Desulfurivibrio sp. D14AmB TaxID=3374370 RepID=UPI00376EC2FD